MNSDNAKHWTLPDKTEVLTDPQTNRIIDRHPKTWEIRNVGDGTVAAHILKPSRAELGEFLTWEDARRAIQQFEYAYHTYYNLPWWKRFFTNFSFYYPHPVEWMSSPHP